MPPATHRACRFAAEAAKTNGLSMLFDGSGIAPVAESLYSGNRPVGKLKDAAAEDKRLVIHVRFRCRVCLGLSPLSR
jgi:hypothetical protein